MENSWALLAICWYLQHFIVLTQGQQASLEIVSLSPSAQSASYTLLPSTISTSPEHSLTPTVNSANLSTLSSKELLLSGTCCHEASTPTASLSGSNGTTTHVPITTLTDLNGTKTVISPHRPTNTQPCNLHVEFCGRSYGNITYVGAHNSPFTRENNAAANQHLDTTTQLNDGIRMRMYFS